MTRGVTSKGVPWVSADEVFDEWDRQAAENAAHQERALEVMHWMIIGRAIGAFVDIVYEGPGASF